MNLVTSTSVTASSHNTDYNTYVLIPANFTKIYFLTVPTELRAPTVLTTNPRTRIHPFAFCSHLLVTTTMNDVTTEHTVKASLTASPGTTDHTVKAAVSTKIDPFAARPGHQLNWANVNMKVSRKGKPDIQVLSNVEGSVNPRELSCIIGHSGSGKVSS
jgi:ABC-type multidrug transport system fused ATPase/permease subunit